MLQFEWRLYINKEYETVVSVFYEHVTNADFKNDDKNIDRITVITMKTMASEQYIHCAIWPDTCESKTGFRMLIPFQANMRGWGCWVPEAHRNGCSVKWHSSDHMLQGTHCLKYSAHRDGQNTRLCFHIVLSYEACHVKMKKWSTTDYSFRKHSRLSLTNGQYKLRR